VETTELDGGDIDAVASSLIIGEEPEQDEADAEDAQDEIEDDTDSEEPSDEDDSDEEDESEDEAEEAEDAGQPELYAVKVDGQERKVTLDDLKRSYSGQAYIQKGMQEVAGQKKQAEEVYSALLQERQQMSQLLQQLNSGQYLQAPVAPSRELFNKDPIGYMEAKMKYDEDVQAWYGQQQAIEQAKSSQAQQMEHARSVHLQGQLRELQQAIPEFGDAKKAARLKEELIAYGAKEGYSADELNDVADARAIKVLRKAMLYDQINSKRSEAEKKVQNAKPFVKPGAKKSATVSNAKARSTANSRMKKSGSVDDVAAYLLS
jgi:hypothetical protein